jgi:sec-independent protein translocase protein TatC
MRKLLQSIKKIITAPIQFLLKPFRRFFVWLASIFTNLKHFFNDEPEDAPIADAFAKTVENPAGLYVHLNALRKHLLRAALFLALATSLGFIFNKYILEILTRPLGGMSNMVAIDVTEPLSTVMKVSLLTGLAISLPYIAFEIYLFIAPGISSKARKWGLLSIPVVLVLFITGVAFAYFIMLPAAIPFLLNIMGIQTQVRPSSYINFVSRVLFWIGIIFEFPLVIYILSSMGLVTAKTLASHWRLAIVIIAAVAALVTPTVDPVNMAIVMAPMIVLYFVSIFLAKIAGRNRTPVPETSTLNATGGS